MKRLIILLALALPCYGQILDAVLNSAPSATSTGIAIVMFPNNGTVSTTARYLGNGLTNTTEAAGQFQAPATGTAKYISCAADVADVGGSAVCTLRINGADAVTCTMASGAGNQRCSASNGVANVNAGDPITMKVVGTSTAAKYSAYVGISGSTTGILQIFSAAVASATKTYFTHEFNNATESSVLNYFPITTNIVRVRGDKVTADAGGTTTVAFDNNAGTDLASCSVAISGKTCDSGAISVAITKGNQFAGAISQPSTTSSNYTASAQLADPTVTYLVFYGAAASSVKSYLASNFTNDTTESNISFLSPVSGNATELYVGSNINAGAGTTPVTLFKDGSPTALVATIANGAKSASATGQSIALTKGVTKCSVEINNSAAGGTFGVIVRVEGAN